MTKHKFSFKIPVTIESDDEYDEDGNVDETLYTPSRQLLEYVAEEFTNEHLEQYAKDDERYALRTLNRIVATVGKDDIDEITVTGYFSRKPGDRTKNHLMDAVEGQCSDGWGESFEQQLLFGSRFSDGNLPYKFYVHTWPWE